MNILLCTPKERPNSNFLVSDVPESREIDPRKGEGAFPVGKQQGIIIKRENGILSF